MSNILRKLVDLANEAQDAAWYLAYDVRQKVAGLLLDTELGKAIVVQWFFREHIRRAEELDSDMYCIYHACDSKNCPDDGTHVDDDEVQVN